MTPAVPWTATIVVRRPERPSADRIARALAPEAAREIPRSHAILRRPSDCEVVLDVEANDTGALRAAVNAYLGWVRLALEAEAVARESAAPPAPGS